jgi:hypothetical protein
VEQVAVDSLPQLAGVNIVGVLHWRMCGIEGIEWSSIGTLWIIVLHRKKLWKNN